MQPVKRQMGVISPDLRPVHPPAMEPVAGAVSLDFANTANRPDGRTPVDDKLTSYGDLAAWAERTGILSSDGAARLAALASKDPDAAGRVLSRARELRELIYRVFTLDDPDASDIELLGEVTGEAASRLRLGRVDGEWAFAWPRADSLEAPLWAVALAAAELLVSEDRARVKRCAAETCNWLFVDRSRNRSRRWCDMKDCGNRAKARRFQARRRRSQN